MAPAGAAVAAAKKATMRAPQAWRKKTAAMRPPRKRIGMRAAPLVFVVVVEVFGRRRRKIKRKGEKDSKGVGG